MLPESFLALREAITKILRSNGIQKSDEEEKSGEKLELIVREVLNI
jgi:hypothetical protein